MGASYSDAGRRRTALPTTIARLNVSARLSPASPDTLKVVLRGSGMGPRVNLEQFEGVINQTRKTSSGPLQGPEDMLTIEIGKKISMHRFAR